MIPRRFLLPIAVAVGLVQVGLLVFMIASRAAILRDGVEVVLQVEPVDPRDLLRGDYVILGYNISAIPTEILEGTVAGEAGEQERPIYVRLKAGEDGIWEPVAARYDEPPSQELQAGEVDILGSTHRWWSPSSAFVDVRYGIERFYVPEGEGREIESNLNVRSFTMKVAVGADGVAQIKSFHDGDTMLYAEPLY